MSPSPIVSQISTLEVSVSVTAGVTLTSLPAVPPPWSFEFCPPERHVPCSCHWRGVGAEQLCSLPHSQLLSCRLACVLQLWMQFPSGCDVTDLAVPLSGLWSSVLYFMLCTGVVTMVRAAWQGDEERSSAHLQDKEQCLPSVETPVLRLW